MRVLIVGASGLVGSHCLTQFKLADWEVVGTHLNFATEDTVFFNPEFIGNESEGAFSVRAFMPDVIVHCGALTNVDYCELHSDISEEGTLTPTKHLVAYCKQYGVKLIYISTDYVFDGLSGPYIETAIVNPINVYGKHKLQCEQLTTELSDFIILRITNVYGEEVRSKNFIARLIQSFQTNESKTITLPTDQFATPIYAGDMARLAVLLLKDNKRGIYHIASTDFYTRYQLALKVKSYFPNNTSIQFLGIKTTELNQPAKRPLYGGLLNIKISLEYPQFEFVNIDSFLQKNILI